MATNRVDSDTTFEIITFCYIKNKAIVLPKDSISMISFALKLRGSGRRRGMSKGWTTLRIVIRRYETRAGRASVTGHPRPIGVGRSGRRVLRVGGVRAVGVGRSRPVWMQRVERGRRRRFVSRHGRRLSVSLLGRWKRRGDGVRDRGL